MGWFSRFTGCALVAAAAMNGSPTMAQVHPDFWEVSASAAASAGLDSPIAPIILGNAYTYAKKRNPDDVRTLLTYLQLMLAYISVDQFELFKKVYGAPGNMKINISDFDDSMKDYIPTLRTLDDAYYDRWLNPRPEDVGLRFEALHYAAQHFAEIEVALRQKIAPHDTLDLGDALSNRGLIYKHLDDHINAAIDDYKGALKLFQAARVERNAIEESERAFTMSKAPGSIQPLNAPRSEAAMETFVVSADEPWLFSSMFIAMSGTVSAAIEKNQKEEADKDIAILESAALQSERSQLFLTVTWPCHPYLDATHFWRAKFSQIRMDYAKKFEPDDGDRAKKYFVQADVEFKKSLEITLFSEGGASKNLKAWADSYIDFLKDAGHDKDADDVTEMLKSLGQADFAHAGPEAWRQVLDCPKKAM